MGATTIAHVGDYEEMQRYEPRTWQSVSRIRKDVAALNMPAPEPPMLLYTGNLYVITDGVRRRIWARSTCFPATAIMAARSCWRARALASGRAFQ